ncbi:NAD(P)-dependent dehydrogenase (short-subunit alcohol dehydrogenase family) [Sinobacterium caligoides]|uniref:NAD(P)-dependent dehydrogenase (Short-subunit alcohol dehydrogenase family) n=1 Tax=Sinobacterium caligoides TaxID=933926 RepID=A0A3N2DMZ7_9GAMM|nr:SDR family NAD(P)-dependent oxidoreductase [Sinobacterium caligoides]ROS01184.1 NAD(P)-dependent dehydrogenase (short-subunit alcohol dehydrogenase family) [Sinobacterium caligoides]
MSLQHNRVVVVTGASRGVGKGIALALAATGATVYVTGRSQQEGDAALPGTIYATAEECTRRGGQGIAVVCDHGDDKQVEALFAQVEREQGRLDILVNNALSVPDDLVKPGPFWQKSLQLIDITDVGMRSSYVASYYAAPLLVANGEGLIINTSSFGAKCYMHGPAYGAGKAGVDKMAHDMAHDFRPYNVACLSLWMGLITTERTLALIATEPDLYGGMLDIAESPEFSGRVIDAIANDKDFMAKSGAVHVAAELALEYGVQDLGGKQPLSNAAMFGEPTVFSDAVVE